VRLSWDSSVMAMCDGAHRPPICGATCHAVVTPFELARMFLLGLELSVGHAENGNIGWVDACGDALARGSDGSYYRHELGDAYRARGTR
jgi:hypothetical protein